MFLTENTPYLLQHFLLYLRYLLELALISKRLREIIHRRDYVRIFLTENTPLLL
jgi:hypothetical protein